MPCERLRVWVRERNEGSAPLFSNLLVAFKALQGLIPDRSSYTQLQKKVCTYIFVITIAYFNVSMYCMVPKFSAESGQCHVHNQS